MKKKGQGRKGEFTPLAFGGSEEVKSSARTVVDESATILSPEGASMKDLCNYNEDCSNESCKYYHPKWAVKICIPNAQGNCKRACKKQHLEWKDMIALATPD